MNDHEGGVPDELDEIDIALINALQIHSRATWALIGRIIGVSPVTAARRWDNLVSNGIAWVTAYGHSATWGCLAYVEIDCASAATAEVAAALMHDTCAVTIEMTGNARCLLVTTTTPDISTLSDYVRNRVSNLDGVVSTKVHVATRLYAESARWSLQALTPEQHSMLVQEMQAVESTRLVDAEDRAMLIELAADGRRTPIELASVLGMSAAKARRRLNGMIRSGTVRLRCEVAQSYTRWPVKVIYQGSCPPSELDNVGRVLAASPDVRVCVAVMGADNLLFSVWLPKPSTSIALEIELARRLPQLTITNRMLALHSMKRMGRLLDGAGRSVGAVPMDMWHTAALADESN